jgi:hypothetical protein
MLITILLTMLITILLTMLMTILITILKTILIIILIIILITILITIGIGDLDLFSLVQRTCTIKNIALGWSKLWQCSGNVLIQNL